MKRFNYRAISLIPGLVKLIERDRPRSSERSHVLRMQFQEALVPGHAHTPPLPGKPGAGILASKAQSLQRTWSKRNRVWAEMASAKGLDPGHSCRALGPQCGSDFAQAMWHRDSRAIGTLGCWKGMLTRSRDRPYNM